jgi:hypothetical protein
VYDDYDEEEIGEAEFEIFKVNKGTTSSPLDKYDFVTPNQ